MEYTFFNHPFWTLIVFGFVFCPRILLVALWYPVRLNFAQAISYPTLSYVGWFFAPRLTLACVFAGYYWQTDRVLVVITIVVSLMGDWGEKFGIKKIFKKFYK